MFQLHLIYLKIIVLFEQLFICKSGNFINFKKFRAKVKIKFGPKWNFEKNEGLFCKFLGTNLQKKIYELIYRFWNI